MENYSQLYWSKKYHIGDKRLDQDHEFVFDLFNEASDVLSGKHNPDFLQQLLNRLMDLSHIHFRDEEVLMQRIGYSEYKSHMEQHKILLQRIDDLMEKFRLGHGVTPEEALAFMKEWIENHILIEDLKIGAALAK